LDQGAPAARRERYGHTATDLATEGGIIMRVRISRWVLGPALALAVAAGGAILGPSSAHGQSITGLGQADQVFNVCQYPAALLDGFCAVHEKAGGGRKKQVCTGTSDGAAAPTRGQLTPY
jgi:hypothetical protein